MRAERTTIRTVEHYVTVTLTPSEAHRLEHATRTVTWDEICGDLGRALSEALATSAPDPGEP